MECNVYYLLPVVWFDQLRCFVDRSLGCMRENPSSLGCRSEPRFDDEYGWMISISSRKAINVTEVGNEVEGNA